MLLDTHHNTLLIQFLSHTTTPTGWALLLSSRQEFDDICTQSVAGEISKLLKSIPDGRAKSRHAHSFKISSIRFAFGDVVGQQEYGPPSRFGDCLLVTHISVSAGAHRLHLTRVFTTVPDRRKLPLHAGRTRIRVVGSALREIGIRSNRGVIPSFSESRPRRRPQRRARSVFDQIGWDGCRR